MTVRFSAPANLLVAGEYVVTLEGGRGIAVAVEPRGTATVERTGNDAAPTVETRMGGAPRLAGDDVGKGGGQTSGETPIVTAVMETVREHAGRPLPPGTSIVIDTTPFFDREGRKLGFGSSAVSAVLLTAAALEASGVEPRRGVVCRLATEAHRTAHGGRGSGYDVATSTYGGWGLFTGGGVPQWRPLPMDAGRPFIAAARLFTRAGRTPVSTAPAVRRFERWRNSPEARGVLEAMSRSVDELGASGNPDAFAESWNDAVDAGLAIGSAIGVSADISPFREGARFVKASGAGDERALLLEFDPSVTWSAPWRELSVDGEGLRRER